MPERPDSQNEDDHPFAIEVAMHTYLRVAKDVSVEGLRRASATDKVRGRYTTQRGDP